MHDPQLTATDAGRRGDRAAWLAQREKGTATALRLLLGLIRLGGRGFARVAVTGAAAYYVVFAGTARRSSLAYLRRVLGHATLATTFRHILAFAHVTLDRAFLLNRDLSAFDFTEVGSEHIYGLAERGEGALLLGAHLGSYEAMRALSNDVGVHINILANFDNAEKITTFLAEASGGDPGINVIPIDPRDSTFLLKVQKIIAGGGLVAMLGDRVFNEKSVNVDFFGSPAPLPAGPYIMASILKSPVYLVFGLYEAPNRYTLICEPFADRVVLPRKDRQAALREYAQRYADRLEHYCRVAPFNWFNFYDFWARAAAEGDPRTRAE